MLSIAVLMLGLLSVNRIYASEASSSVTVSYIPDTVYTKVKLEVEVSGQGTLYDADQAIRDGIITYEIQDKDIKNFMIYPDSGYELSKLEYNDGYQIIDMRKAVENDSLSITVKDKDASLVVGFDKKKNEDNEQNKPDIDNNDNTVNTGIPQTGDSSHGALAVTIMFGALMFILLYWKKSRKEEEHK